MQNISRSHSCFKIAIKCNLRYPGRLCGVLSQGGDSYSSYVSPYYFINWINSTLPKAHNIKVDFKLEDQYPHSKTQVIPVKEFPSFNKTQGQSYRPGWDIDNEQVCWPSVLPCIAGHVGADAAAVALSEEPEKSDDLVLIVDVGTNAEILLGNT